MSINYTIFNVDTHIITSRVTEIPMIGVAEDEDWVFGDFDDTLYRIAPADPQDENSAPTPYLHAPTLTQADLVNRIVKERRRRFELGFDYDFQDSRGIHHFGTTAEDMKGWDDVTQISNALINVGAPTAEIYIETETGPVTVTAFEWQQVLIFAGQTKQAIWLRSFDLQKIDPIPQDVVSNQAWWTEPLETLLTP